MAQLLVFSDIDGTLIDFATYSYAESTPAVTALLARHIPLILCSSKTRAEQESLRRDLFIPDPFIVENGSAIFIPPGVFSFDFSHRAVDGWQVVELGVTAVAIHHRQTAIPLLQQQRDHLRPCLGCGFALGQEPARLCIQESSLPQRRVGRMLHFQA